MEKVVEGPIQCIKSGESDTKAGNVTSERKTVFVPSQSVHVSTSSKPNPLKQQSTNTKEDNEKSCNRNE